MVRPAAANAQDYLEWVSRTRSYGDFTRLNGDLQFPTLEDEKAAKDAYADNEKLAVPIGELMKQFYSHKAR